MSATRFQVPLHCVFRDANTSLTRLIYDIHHPEGPRNERLSVVRTEHAIMILSFQIKLTLTL